MSMTGWNSYGELAENVTDTEKKFHKATYIWTINTFRGRDTLDSPKFSASTNPEVKWYINLRYTYSWCVKTFTFKQFICLRLYLSDKSKEKEMSAKCSFSVFDNNEVRNRSVNSKEFYNFLSERSLVKNEEYAENLMHRKGLQIHCEVIYHKTKVIPEYALFLQSAVAKYDSPGILDVLLKTRLLSDIVISMKTKEFPAHKAILAARSKVFAAMFQHDTKESQQNRIEIEDMSEETVAEMLHFIYVGKCSEKLDELAMELYVAADKYDLDLLKILCIQALFRNLSVENVVQNFILADTYGVTEFKSEVIKFIVANAAKVFDTEEWKIILNDPRLSQEVFRAMARQLDCGGDRDGDPGVLTITIN